MKFKFEAKGANGKEFRGEIEAVNEIEARIKLRAQRLMPLKLVVSNGATAAAAAKKKKTGGGVKSKDLQIFTRQLATLLSSGVPILQAMETLSDGSRSPGLTFALKAIGEDVSAGKRFGDAVAAHPKVFDRFFANMVLAGEESGNLDEILNRLAVYIEKSVKIQGKVKGALAYPIGIMVVAMLVVSGLLVFVIPKFKTMFEGSGQELPGPTQLVVAMSEFFIGHWYVVIGGAIATVWGFIAFYKSPKGREICDGIFIATPVFGDLMVKSGVARFTRTLSTLLGSGVGIMEALDISARTVGNHIMESAIVRAKDAIAEGKSLTVPLSKEKYIPHMVTQMIGVGEQTGALDTMLAKVADFYEDEVDVAVGALTSLMEPMMMVVLGGIVGFFVIAMYLPIFGMASAVGGG
jgi:type IV pilus assembly protein PilC